MGRTHHLAGVVVTAVLVVGTACAATAQPLPPGRTQVGGTETMPLTAVTVSMVPVTGLSPNDTGNALRLIWHDAFEKELATRRRLSQATKRPEIVTTDVFEATFKTNEATLVVSARATPDTDCVSGTNLGLSPNLLTCPMRVALVRGDSVNVIYAENTFPFSVAVTPDGHLSNERPLTTLSFDSERKTIRTELRAQSDLVPLSIATPNLSESNTEIQLK